MFNKKLVLSALAIALLTTSGFSFSREASEGPRGADRVHGGTHKNSADVDSFIIAREASEAPRGADNNNRQRGRNKATEDASEMILARHGADDPVGSERPGEVHGQRRGGRA